MHIIVSFTGFEVVVTCCTFTASRWVVLWKLFNMLGIHISRSEKHNFWNCEETVHVSTFSFLISCRNFESQW